jgi:hypothetical protein
MEIHRLKSVLLEPHSLVIYSLMTKAMPVPVPADERQHETI